jgi:hypothetical protein
MQDPNEDTEWNDILRRKGIIPQLERPEEIEDPEPPPEKGNYDDMKDDELDFLLEDEMDDEEVRLMERIREQRLNALKAQMEKQKFGDVYDVTGETWVQEINKAPEGIWVIVHLYDKGVMLSNILNQHFVILAQKFKEAKFVRGIAKVIYLLI